MAEDLKAYAQQQEEKKAEITEFITEKQKEVARYEQNEEYKDMTVSIDLESTLQYKESELRFDLVRFLIAHRLPYTISDDLTTLIRECQIKYPSILLE